MFSKRVGLSKSYLYGFFASMISVLIYSAVVIPIYILLISSNSHNFFVYLLYTLDVWVWIWICVSILYAFITVILFNSNNSLIENVCNFLFFTVTSIAVLLSLSYVPEIQKILYREEYTFYGAILSIGLFFISLQLTYSVKKLIIFMYKTILYNLGYEIEEVSEDDNYNETNDLESEIFFNTMKNVISFSQRHEYAIGIMAFKILNYKKILEEYGDSEYKKAREELVKFIKQNSRTGESQCLIEDNLVYTFIYANEDEAWKITRRYLKGLKNYNFEYGGDYIDISMAVSGYDFSDNKINKISAFVIKDNLVAKLQDALIEAEETGNPVVLYQKGI